MIRYPFKNEPIETDTLTVTVSDGTDPISGATVTIDGSTETTDALGSVEFDLEYGDYTATISASGYTTATEELAFRSNHKNFTVTLESASGTGTVTVTCQDSESTPLENVEVRLLTENADPSQTNQVGAVYTDSTGVGVLKTLDDSLEPTETDADVPYGDYYLWALGEDSLGNQLSYIGALTVDGNETVTITLTEQ